MEVIKRSKASELAGSKALCAGQYNINSKFLSMSIAN